MSDVQKDTLMKYCKDEWRCSKHWYFEWLWEGPRLRRGGSHSVMRYVRCFSNSGWTDPWSRVTAWCPDVQRGPTLSCKKRGQLGPYNKTIHVCNEVVFPEREKLTRWMAGGQMIGSEGGGGWVKVRGEGVEGGQRPLMSLCWSLRLLLTASTGWNVGLE